MKMKTHLSLLALAAAALSLNITTGTAQSVDSVESLKNHAVAASPRAKEAFPWLARTSAPVADACCAEATAKNELTDVRKNRALAASPRALEQFPELGRPSLPRQQFTLAPLVEKNTAVLSSPRVQEEFPALSRGPTPSTARGGASKLMELGK